jgi:FkbM family methyltransferase
MELIFDIGANKGSTVDFYKNYAKKVVCFEPNPNLVSTLKSRFENSNVIVDSRGLSNIVGKKKFMISNADTISTFSESWVNNSRFSDSYKWNEGITVETTTLDSILNEYGIPDFIKIDVEGYEYEVLLGLNVLLENTVFAFEWAEEQFDGVQKSVKHLQNVGYNNFAFIYGDSPSLGNNLEYKSWEELEINNDIIPSRKNKWGMIYFKK